MEAMVVSWLGLNAGFYPSPSWGGRPAEGRSGGGLLPQKRFLAHSVRYPHPGLRFAKADANASAFCLKTAAGASLCRPSPQGGGIKMLRANRLDIVAVGIDQERGEIGRAVIGPRAGGAIVAASGPHALAVEFLDRGVVGRPERDVGTAAGRPLVRIQPERRVVLGPAAGAGFIALAKDISERRQCRRVKAHAGVEIADFQSDVVVHGDLQ